VQGLRDPNVSPENVEAVEKELKQFKVPYEKLVFDDEGHGISKEHNLRILYPKIVEFFTSAFLS
jgi:dipeptidyl aminopeptidase/acylaminoacyl peptidase